MIDSQYTVQVDNGTNTGASLRYARWDYDESAIEVTETSNGSVLLNESGEEYITMPLILLSFAYGNGVPSNTIAQICCPTNMVGYTCQDDIGQFIGTEYNATSYHPFETYSSCDSTIFDTKFFSDLRDSLADDLIIDSLVLPKTVSNMYVDDLRIDGGFGIHIKDLVLQCDGTTLRELIDNDNGGFTYLNDECNTSLYFTDLDAMDLFIEAIDNGLVSFNKDNVFPSSVFISDNCGEIPDITRLTPVQGRRRSNQSGN